MNAKENIRLPYPRLIALDAQERCQTHAITEFLSVHGLGTGMSDFIAGKANEDRLLREYVIGKKKRNM